MADVEAGTGEMLIARSSLLADGLTVDISCLLQDRTDRLHVPLP